MIPVLTAASDSAWEAALVAALDRGDLGVTVARRCVDLPDLLATAATGQGRCALLSAELRRLDGEAVQRLAAVGVAVVGLVAPGDERSERWLRQLGLQHVLPSDAAASVIASAVEEAVALLARSSAYGDPAAALPVPEVVELEQLGEPGQGRVVAVWGPTGAPGRTTVATALATELALLGWPTLLVDADVYGGVIAQALGLLDESPGLAAAARQANAGTLDLSALARLALQVTPTLRVLTGISRAERWTEVRPAGVEVVLELARTLAAVTVVDCGFSLEQDEELSYDTLAPRRNGATLAVLEQADLVVVVGSADPVGLQRLVRGLAELRQVVPDVRTVVVANRLRSSAVPGDAEAEVRAALARHAGVEKLTVVPLDVAGVDAALASGRTLAEAAATSPARLALQGLAASLVGNRTGVRRKGLLRR